MSSKKRAQAYFSSRKLDLREYAIGHLKDELAKLYARDFFLIGYVEESEILSENDRKRYTAIVELRTGKACGVFFDIPRNPEIQAGGNAQKRKFTTQVSH